MFLVALLLMVQPMVMAFAADTKNDAPTLKLSAAYDEETNQVTATVKLEPYSNLWALTLDLKYDKSVLAVNAMTTAGIAETAVPTDMTQKSQVRFSYICVDNLNGASTTESQTIMTVVFDVIGGGETALTIANIRVVNPTAENLFKNAGEGSVLSAALKLPGKETTGPSQPTIPTEPTSPSQGVKPDPTNPSQGEKPEPTNPVKPDPTNPSQGEKPEPTNPVRPDPTNPSQGEKPEPTNPVKPDPTNPSQGEKPEPTNPVKPDPTNPSQGEKPEPTDPDKPSQPTAPSQPDTPDPGEPETFKITGRVSSYNSKNETVIKLYKAGHAGEESALVKDAKIAIDTDASAKAGDSVEQVFVINGVANGEYDLVISKIAHLSYTVKGIKVDNNDVDLTAHANAAIQTITLPAGNVTTSGSEGEALINSDDLNFIWRPQNYLKKASDAGVESIADINGDGEINSDDLNIIWRPANYLKKLSDCIAQY